MKAIKEAVAWLVTIAGQVPAISSALSHPLLSLYQPYYSDGRHAFLFLPLAIAFVATWCATRSDRGFILVAVLTVLTFAVVFAVWELVPASSAIHKLNWLLYYCAISLLVAVIARVVSELWPSSTSDSAGSGKQ